MGKRILTVLLGAILLFAGLVICVRPVCARVIHEAFLGRAVALRANDVIWNWYSDEDLDWAIGLQERVTAHRQLDRVAGKYLDALADYYRSEKNGTEGNFQEPDVSENLKALNEDMIQELEDKYKTGLSEIGRASLAEELYEVELPVIDTLNELPFFIRSFSWQGWMALGFYAFLTSWQLFLGLAASLGALGFWIYRLERDRARWSYHMGVLLMTDGAILGILVPLFVRSVSYRITNRLIGRSWMIDTSAFLYTGILFVLVGAALLFYWFRKTRKQPLQDF